MTISSLRRLRPALVAGALGVALLVPASAGAAIVPQTGIAGVRLDDTKREVRAKLGAPDRIARRNLFFGRVTVYRYGRTSFTFSEGRGRVLSMTTKDRDERTRNGVGVGTHRTVVDRRVRGSNCDEEVYGPTCVVGRPEPGRVVTQFVLNRRDRVSQITIGYVID